MKNLPREQGVLLEECDVFGEQAFRESAAAEFPELATQLNELPGLHIAMGVLASAARAAVRAADPKRLQAIYAFLERALTHPKATSELENAVAISFLAAAELRQSANGRRALELMPARVRDPILHAEQREDQAALRRPGTGAA